MSETLAINVQRQEQHSHVSDRLINVDDPLELHARKVDRLSTGLKITGCGIAAIGIGEVAVANIADLQGVTILVLTILGALTILTGSFIGIFSQSCSTCILKRH